MNRIRRNKIISIFGKKGSGKTTFVKTKIVPNFSRIIIIDMMNEYFFDNSKDIRSDSKFYAKSVSEFMVRLDEVWKRKDFLIIYKPRDAELEEIFTILHHVGNTTIIVEEIHLIPRQITNAPMGALYKIFSTGRHRNTNVIGTAQRPFRVSRDLTAQSDIIISLRQTEKRDIEYLTEYSENPETLAQNLRKLDIGEHIVIQGNDEF